MPDADLVTRSRRRPGAAADANRRVNDRYKPAAFNGQAGSGR